MRILVTNDDGVLSEGLSVIAEWLSRENEIVVVAPDGNRSAFSHSLSIHSDLVFRECKISDKITAYSLSGTPADCVKFAVHFFENKKFDLVVSGINYGNNLGSDTAYSGTVSAALEGNYFGIPSIALSNVSHINCLFSENIKVLEKIFPKMLEVVSPEYTLNVNIPNVNAEDIAGVKFAPLGVCHYSDYYLQTENGNFRLEGEPIVFDEDGDSDVIMSYKGYVTLTPILYNRTDFAALAKFKNMEFL